MEDQGIIGTLFKDVPVVKEPGLGAPKEPERDDVHKELGISPVVEVDCARFFRKPALSVPPKLPTIEELSAKSPHLVASDSLAAKEAVAAQTRSSLASLPADHHLYQTIAEDLAKQEAVITKMHKKAPGSALLAEKVKLVKQEQVQQETLQAQNAESGKLKAAQHLQEQLKAIDEVSRDLVRRRAAVVEAHTAANLAWAEYRAKQKAQWQQLFADFDAEILKLETAATQASLPNAHDPPAPTANLVPDALMDQVAADTQRAGQVVAAAVQAHQMSAALRIAASAPTPAMSELHRVFQCDSQDLPKQLAEPQPAQWVLLHQLWCSLETIFRNEHLAGEPVPITMAQLHAGEVVPKMVLGEVIWAKAFPGQQPTADSVLPLQVRNLLWMSLQLHRDKLLQDKARQEEAQVAVGAMVEETMTEFRNKRRRAEPPAPADVPALPASTGAPGAASGSMA